MIWFDSRAWRKPCSAPLGSAPSVIFACTNNRQRVEPGPPRWRKYSRTMRVWCSGNSRLCHSLVPSSILGTRSKMCYNVAMTSPTTQQGNIGEAAVILDAVKRGWHVSLPMEGAAYDLVVDRHGKLFRVQVRSTSSKDGKLVARLRSSTSNAVDVLAVHDLVSGKTYWIPFDKIDNATGMVLRLTETRQDSRWMAKDFEDF
jgi:hypothetical protein